MKPLITALVIGIVALAPAFANAAAFTWDGSPSNVWDNGRNWGQGAATPYPGSAQAGDTATVDVTTSANPLFLAASVANDVADVTLNALTAGGALKLEIRTGATLNINDATTGTLSLVGGDTSGETATFNYQAGTLSIDNMDLDGGSASTMAAILDMDASFTIDDTTDSVLAAGYVKVDVATGAAINLKEMQFVADGTFELAVAGTGTYQNTEFRVEDDGADAVIAVTKSGAGTLTASTLVVKGGDSAGETATFTVTAGSVVTQ
jgi:hypothetical protein